MSIQSMYQSSENKAVLALVALFIVFHFAIVMLLN